MIQKESIKHSCAISVDMDPIYHYLNARGYLPKEKTNLNAIYDEAIYRFLNLFEEYQCKATFFIVGKDALYSKNKSVIKQIDACGHEIANHTLNHHPGFGSLSFEDKRYEIEECDKILSDLIGKRIYGFRAPGWDIDSETLSILETLNYSYDSSVFPSYFAGLISHINRYMNRKRLKSNLGTKWIALSPKLPYHPDKFNPWKKGDMDIIELPLTILPIVQFPFLGTMMFLLNKRFFSLCFAWLNMFKNRPLIYILHGIELVDYYKSINDYRLSVKPGLTKTIQEKLLLYNFMLSKFKQKYYFVTMKELSELRIKN